MKKLIVFFLCSLLISCVTTTPILIHEVPKHNIREDMKVDEYIKESTEYAINLRAYIDELINQITHKANYIDLRQEKENGNADGNRKPGKDK